MSDDESDYESYREPEIIEKRTIDAYVNGYYVDGDSQIYENHYFTIHVRVEDIFFTVDRSYVDFVELDRRLRKIFPRSNILPLPLDNTESLEKVLSEKERGSKRKTPKDQPLFLSAARDVILNGLDQVSSSPLSISNILGGGSFHIKERIQEDISSKVMALNLYVAALLTLPEVVASDVLLLFLDEEATSMTVDPNSLLPLSEHDLLLINVVPTKCVVRRTEKATFKIQAGEFIVWKFSTLDFDIGFSVELNGEKKIPYTRYKSHEKPIFGTLEATQAGTCTLIWDNTYARLRSKQLSWVAKVVKDKDYHAARQKSLDIQREKKKFEDQRHALQRCSANHVALLSGVILGTNVVSDQAQEEKLLIRELEDEINSLKNNIRQYQADIEQGQIELDALEDDLQNMQNSRQLINDSWQFAVKQLEAARSDLKNALLELSTVKTSEKNLKSTNRILQDEIAKMRQDLLTIAKSDSDIKSSYVSEKERFESEKESMQNTINKLQTSFEERLLSELNAERIKIEERLRSEYDMQIQDLQGSCRTLEEKFLRATVPKDFEQGYFADTVSEAELRQRLQQLERENSFLESQKETLEEIVSDLRKQLNTEADISNMRMSLSSNKSA